MTNKSKFRQIFSNNLTLMIMSLLFAFVIWFVINANSQTDTNVTVSDIPIVIELPEESVEDGLEVFTGADTKASVEVSGNRLTVGALKNTDIQVIALQSNSIIAPGNYSLELSARKVGVKSNYNIVSDVSPSNVSLFVDRRKEKEFEIYDEIIYKVDDGCYAAPSLSEATVNISGPESEVSAIDRVVVQGSMTAELGEKITKTVNLVFLDKDGKKVDVSKSILSSKFVDVTLTVMPTVEVSLTADVANAPSTHPQIVMNPDKIKIAASKETLDAIKDNVVNIGTIDFSKLRNEKNVLNYDITLPNGCKNLSKATSTKVSIDLSSYEKTQLTIDSFTARNIDLSKYNVDFSSNGIDVTVYGPKSFISSISADNITAFVNLSDFESKINSDATGISLELPLSFEFKGSYKSCWVYGDYTDVITVKKK